MSPSSAISSSTVPVGPPSRVQATPSRSFRLVSPGPRRPRPPRPARRPLRTGGPRDAPRQPTLRLPAATRVENGTQLAGRAVLARMDDARLGLTGRSLHDHGRAVSGNHLPLLSMGRGRGTRRSAQSLEAETDLARETPENVLACGEIGHDPSR